MALKLLQPGNQPLGQFDGMDTYTLSLLGGEVVTFSSTLLTSTDKAAKDAFDGYALPATPSRPFVVPLGRNSTTSAARPLMLADEGIAGYGTLFGTVVGGTVGQVSTGGTVLGPHTATGSGKVTCWDKPGLYGITLDALASDVQPTTSIAVGTPLYATVANTASAGFLTATSSGNVLCGTFIEFVTNGSLVNTPNYLVAALNSPSGDVSSVQPRSFAWAVVHFNPNP